MIPKKGQYILDRDGQIGKVLTVYTIKNSPSFVDWIIKVDYDNEKDDYFEVYPENIVKIYNTRTEIILDLL